LYGTADGVGVVETDMDADGEPDFESVGV